MNTAPMTRRKHDKNDTGRTIAQKIIDEYQPKNVDEMQDALKDIFGPMFEAMLQGEISRPPSMTFMVSKSQQKPFPTSRTAFWIRLTDGRTDRSRSSIRSFS